MLTSYIRPVTSSRARRLLVPFILSISVFILASLAGCAPSASSDPVTALRVDGTPVTLSAYQQILALFTASAGLQASASSPALSWQAPADRTTLNNEKEQTVNFFVSTMTLKEQLDRQHITVSQKDIDVAVAALNTQVANVRAQVRQNPGNARYQALLDAATPDAIRLLAEQQAYTTAFIQKGSVPVAKVRGILLKTEADAQKTLQDVQSGQDFATLAKERSLDTQSAPNGGDLGSVFVGQFVAAFDAKIFDKQSTSRYVIVPFQGSYGLFEVESRSTAKLSTVSDQQSQQQYLNGWINDVLMPQAQVDNYVGR